MINAKRKQRKTFNEINITPLTDIFLVLLIIMMVVAPMLDQQGLSLAVPTSQEAQKEMKEQSKLITIDVTEDGKYLLNSEVLEEQSMIKLLKENAKEKNGGLLIRAASDSTHGAVVKLMDIARTAGVFSISLVEE